MSRVGVHASVWVAAGFVSDRIRNPIAIAALRLRTMRIHHNAVDRLMHFHTNLRISYAYTNKVSDTTSNLVGRCVHISKLSTYTVVPFSMPPLVLRHVACLRGSLNVTVYASFHVESVHADTRTLLVSSWYVPVWTSGTHVVHT